MQRLKANGANVCFFIAVWIVNTNKAHAQCTSNTLATQEEYIWGWSHVCLMSFNKNSHHRHWSLYTYEPQTERRLALDRLHCQDEMLSRAF